MRPFLIRAAPAIAFVAALGVPTGVARADYLYNNIDAAPDGSDSIAGAGPLADSFSTGNAAVLLKEVDVFLVLPSGSNPTGTVKFSLLSDNNTTPGTQIAVLGTVADSSIGSTPIVFNSFAPVQLAAHTRYWIEASTANGSSAQWYWSVDTSGPGVAGEFFFNYGLGDGESFPNTAGPYLMSVSTSVPEPCSIALLAVGGVATLRFRRHRS